MHIDGEEENINFSKEAVVSKLYTDASTFKFHADALSCTVQVT